jgi:hypothetical protein
VAVSGWGGGSACSCCYLPIKDFHNHQQHSRLLRAHPPTQPPIVGHTSWPSTPSDQHIASTAAGKTDWWVQILEYRVQLRGCCCRQHGCLLDSH